MITLKAKNYNYNVPLYYYSKQDQTGYIIIYSGYNNEKTQLQRYNIKENIWDDFETKYLKTEHITSLIDQDQHKLYVIRKAQFAVFDLIKEKWSFSTVTVESKIDEPKPASILIHYPSKQLHIFIY